MPKLIIYSQYGANNMEEEEDYQLAKILIVGNKSCGKTSLLRKFVFDQFSQDQKRTVGVEFVSKVSTINCEPVKMTFWDMSGDPRYRVLFQVYSRNSRVVIVLFDFTGFFNKYEDEKPFESILDWIELTRQHLDHDVPIIVAGNKADLKSEKKQDLYCQIEEQLYELGIHYREVSALTGQNVRELISQALSEVLAQQSKQILNKQERQRM